ncbi:tRNA preQ1(34) S-adenosylmethionine ribosyltransferase-isomerase QueA [Oceanotoga sp. DSM 15011]|jgi:S-adenosylmethionine:tRNA ribosyltransferase-isomerase|uniref:S-adenosylmethionine:tRNA ribosyltransferase-isomerase n=1 Tax=Oceanotoga teriensis TaxID=515440 RepID=A0AA45C969_9BACT|nr:MULTISPECIES: tRNA preQ1(34) S-adenosylmethionine ribosyltransferase-isomerase QueA [Oceanotoga]MDN5341585.1 S-adenosylmethionine:tRNA ribosyltransferase-isomerase [Oceanotoga sp.]MDO7977211.1 tRNA preQ1(34) S-adenosylmethionine ribosyltransferase-isomerase QueA [Oceanotoga teriensis]PWJ96517.1 S-adenosylmethionine--tRNA ribosyltransferase-isomerase [Oceanotoga teriensis]UYP00308.1 tRNA preQ1(34) S-adenosylmethionine ribosyltransferase-isomerase QueA [Oceanotoga sp. DSM 15011]
MYRIEEYDYYLPQEQIAQDPVEPRDSSKLMILDREKKTIEHKIFREIIDYLNPKDLLIVNNTKVIPARIYGKKSTGAKIEILLLEKIGEGNKWKSLVKPGGKIKLGNELIFSNKLKAKVIKHYDDGARLLEFYGENIWDEINKIGETPLPPYIHKKLEDNNRYQTNYAKIEGAVAAPTAGLHFTKELLDKISKKGIDLEEVTLHVGLGTFRPVNEEDIRNHQIHEEYYSISEDVKNKIEETKKNGGRIIAVGTTVVRTLESYALNKKLSGKTNIYIYPPYNFKIVDGLITNFHLPKSSLLMLVSAFNGHQFTMKSYKEAVEKNYRFFSFGDAMFIK